MPRQVTKPHEDAFVYVAWDCLSCSYKHSQGLLSLARWDGAECVGLCLGFGAILENICIACGWETWVPISSCFVGGLFLCLEGNATKGLFQTQVVFIFDHFWKRYGCRWWGSKFTKCPTIINLICRYILTSSYLSNLRWCFILSRLAPLKSSFLFNLEEIVEQSSYFSTESKLSISVPNSEFFRGLSQFIMEPISRNCQIDIQDHPNKMCIIWALYSLRFNREQSRGVNNTTMIVNKLSL